MQGKQIQWDESRSPQWKYLLQQESQQRRIERRVEDEQIRIKRVSKRQKLRKATTKAGKKIVYSASPTGRRYTSSKQLGEEINEGIVGKDKEMVVGK